MQNRNRQSKRSTIFLATSLVLASASPAFAGNTVTGYDAAVAGGDLNSATGDFSFIGGGYQNGASNSLATVGGGDDNIAAGPSSTISGGQFNYASAYKATIGGGDDNNASGVDSTVPGGEGNWAGGDFSFAAGSGAYVRSAYDLNNGTGDKGTFVWADSTTQGMTGSAFLFSSTGQNQFLVRANGGFGLNSAPINANVAMTIQATSGNPGYASIFLRQANSDNGVLVTSGDASTGATNTANNASFYVDQYNGSGHTRRLSLDGSGNLTVTAQAYKPGGGAWAASSDARLKSHIQPLTHALDRLLALRGVTFEYAHPDNGIHPSGVFTGFIAQEVEPNFPNWIGHDAEGYMTVGPQGFEALTVEALRTMKSDNDARVAKLEASNAELQQQIAELRDQIAQLANH